MTYPFINTCSRQTTNQTFPRHCAIPSYAMETIEASLYIICLLLINTCWRPFYPYHVSNLTWQRPWRRWIRDISPMRFKLWYPCSLRRYSSTSQGVNINFLCSYLSSALSQYANVQDLLPAMKSSWAKKPICYVSFQLPQARVFLKWKRSCCGRYAWALHKHMATLSIISLIPCRSETFIHVCNELSL